MAEGVRRIGKVQPVENRIDAIIAPSLEALGFSLLRVRLSGKTHQTLQLMVEHATGDNVNVEECAEISRRVSVLLDVEDLIQDEYLLEVSSPGIDRPIVCTSDFKRYVGSELKITTVRSIDGRKKFRGKLISVEEDGVCLGDDRNEFLISFSIMENAQLVLNDALLAKSFRETHRRQQHGD